MALYIDSAFLEDILAVAKIVPVQGVTTNPTLLRTATERGQTLSIHALYEQLIARSSGTIFVQPSMSDEEKTYQEVLDYRRLAPDRIIPKIPLTEKGLRVAQRLKQQQHPIAFTAVTTTAQAYIAAMVGADFIIPYYNRLQRSGVDAGERVAQIARIFQIQSLPTRIMSASIKSVAEAAAALAAGSHDLTVPPQILLEMITDPDTEKAVAQFEQDYYKMKKL